MLDSDRLPTVFQRHLAIVGVGNRYDAELEGYSALHTLKAFSYQSYNEYAHYRLPFPQLE